MEDGIAVTRENPPLQCNEKIPPDPRNAQTRPYRLQLTTRSPANS